MQRLTWVKSSKSGTNGNCVEVWQGVDGQVLVRNSNDRGNGHLVFTKDEWTAFTAGVMEGEFDVE